MGTGTDVGLAGWLKKLHAFDEAKWRSIGVTELFKELSAPPEDWYDHLQFCEDSCTRNLIGRSHLFELIAVGWLGHQKTPAHDHAGQRSWMWVVHGNLRTQTYFPQKNGLLAVGAPQDLSPGDSLYIDDSLGWVAMENPSQKPAVSLQLYTRPISQYQFFCETTQSFQIQELETISVR